MKLKKIILLIVCFFLLCGCSKQEVKNAANGHSCINCNAPATHFSGTNFDSKTYQTIYLYYCDNCYNEWINEAKENDKIMELEPDPEFDF